MIIDFHTHTFPEQIAAKTISLLENRCGQKAYTNGTLAGLLQDMDEGAVDISVIQPVVTKLSQFDTINRTAVALNEQYTDRIISFGGIHPESANYKEELKTIRSMGLKGIKLHPDYQDTFIDDLKYLHIIDYAAELGLITLIHAGVDVGLPEPVHCTPKAARSVIDQVHPEKLVLAHLGGCDLWDEVANYLAGTEVYLDTAVIYGRIQEEQFLDILKIHGEDKVLFATDSPWCQQKSSVEWMNRQPISAETKALIFSENAKKLLGL